MKPIKILILDGEYKNHIAFARNDAEAVIGQFRLQTSGCYIYLSGNTMFKKLNDDCPKENTAYLSDNRKYRYALWRWWDINKPYLMVIGLNPSTADETKDDATIRRCKKFAELWGFGGLCMVNLSPLRETDRKKALKELLPKGEYFVNLNAILHNAHDAGMILAAWGSDGGAYDRDLDVLRSLRGYGYQVHALSVTKNGKPGHPLYIKADTQPEIY